MPLGWMLPTPPFVVIQVAILSPDLGGWDRGMARWGLWLGQVGGMGAMAVVMVVQGGRSECVGWEVWVGLGKGGRGSPGLGGWVSRFVVESWKGG